MSVGVIISMGLWSFVTVAWETHADSLFGWSWTYRWWTSSFRTFVEDETLTQGLELTVSQRSRPADESMRRKQPGEGVYHQACPFMALPGRLSLVGSET